MNSLSPVLSTGCPRLLVLSLLLFLTKFAAGQTAPPGFSVDVVTDALNQGVVGFDRLPDGRFLVVHHQTGHVELVVDTTVVAPPVLVVDSLVVSSEQGLLGIAVDPDFPDSNYVYLFHSMEDSTNQVARYTVEGDLSDPASSELTIDPATKRERFSAPDTTRFHNGGTVRFGPDEKLYISLGDDAQANRVQNLSNLYGKILRLNRDGSIPDDNPVFPDEPADRRGEVFAFGLRNPFRFSIDPLSGELFIGDVGTDLYQELNLASGGENFGYPHYEGPALFRDFVPLLPPEPLFPIYAYPQTTTARSSIALTSYRLQGMHGAPRFPDAYDGALFYADYFDTTLRYLLKEDGNSAYTTHVFGTGYFRLVDALVAEDGSLYLLSYRGQLLRLRYNTPVHTEADRPEAAFTLHPNYPNPFRGSTTLSYELRASGSITLEVFDLLGRRVRTVHEGWRMSGSHTTAFEPAGLPPGLYLVRLTTGTESQIRRMTYLGG